jgi:hypothetical protein
MSTDKRGLNCQEAAAYLGVKRRAFERYIRPHLASVKLGTSVIFDRFDLDRVFEEYKGRSGRPSELKGGNTVWADQRCGAYTPPTTVPGVSTKSGKASVFDSTVSRIMRKRKAG